MKDIRPKFTEAEYKRLQEEADRLGVSVKELVHDRAIGTVPGGRPLMSAQILSAEISAVREVLNQIIQRETTAEIRLYEDDVIRLELTMTRLEKIVADYIASTLKEAE